MSNLYNGSSEGFRQVADGFMEYALEVGINRSFASIHDGLKTVQRRAVFALDKNKIYKLTKATKAVASVMIYHPHGDEAAYQAMSRMTRSNGSTKPEMFDGEGNFGKSYSNSDPADMRYTTLMLSPVARDLFLDDMDGILWKESETDEGLEPVSLPAKFPMALTASVQGMGVGIANKVPSFNFGDVIRLTKEYIDAGEKFNNQIIYPDLPNGGIVVADNKEMAKIMATGRGRVKSRAKVSISKRDILIEELPYNTTDGSVVDKIKAIIRSNKERKLPNGEPNPNFGNFPYISHEDNVVLLSGLQGFSIKLRCRKAADTEIVIKELQRRGIISNSFMSNMIFTNGQKLVVTGVYGVIEEWFNERKRTLTRKFEKQVSALSGEQVLLSYFLQLIANEEAKNKYLHLIANEGAESAGSYLEELFDGIPAEVVSWISNRRASAFHNGGKYNTRYQSVVSSIETYQGYLNNLNKYISDELGEIDRKYSSRYPRVTKITNTDYKFSKKVEEVVEDTSFCSYILFKDNSLYKANSPEAFEGRDDVLSIINARANSVLVGFDYVGNLIRVYGNDIPMGKTYLPTYIGVAGLVDDYRIMYLTLVDGSRKRLLYSDGRMSVLDTSEFLDKKLQKRLVRNGVPEDVHSQLVEVIDEDSLSQYLYVADESGTLQLGLVDWASLPVKSRTAKTRAFAENKLARGTKITQWGTCNLEEAQNYFTDMEAFIGRMRKVRKGDITFSGSEFEKGRYV